VRLFLSQTLATILASLRGESVTHNENMLAEMVALNQAVTRALIGLAALAGEAGQRDAFVAGLLESGLRDLGATRVTGADPAIQARIVEKARARYTDIVMSLNTQQ
jgi:hypothetical protein